jgi:hypothetical protein
MSDTPAASELSTTVPICFQLGWTMAVLYRELVAEPRVSAPAAQNVATAVSHLPTEHELSTDDRISLEVTRLNLLVKSLNGEGAPYTDLFEPDLTGIPNLDSSSQPTSPAPTPGAASLTALDLLNLNQSILVQLTKCDLEVSLAYQAGRSLRDTVYPPLRPYAELPSPEPSEEYEEIQLVGRLMWAFNRDRVTTIQEWLATLAPYFPDRNAASVVSSSVGRWADFSGVTLDDDVPGSPKPSNSRASIAAAMMSRLFRQGDSWLGLLVGQETTTALLSPEGFVAAGEAALRRTARIIGKVVWRYKWVLFVLAAALAAVLTLSALYLGGASKVWTSIAAIAASLGISWKGISAAIPRLAGDAERPIFGLEEIEAMAWSVTTLPPNTDVTAAGVSYLRRAGVAPSAPLGSSF